MMAQTKYREYYEKMIAENRQLFDDFLKVHDAFKQDQKRHAIVFHQLGQRVVDKIRDFDRRLCSAMGRGVYSTYSQKLSEKFWDLARQDFDQIDMVGVKIKAGK
jgi:hypothetical protein